MPNSEQHLQSLRLSKHRQAVVVETADWNTISGKMHWYEREEGENSSWQEVDRNIPVVVGAKGMGWGIGIHPIKEPAYPLKREGDGKAPAGIFPILHAFGFESHFPTKLSYLEITPTLEAIDDPLSQYYNQIVDTRDIETKDWNSSEKMHEYPQQYHVGVVVGHNTAPVVPYRGSCIFMHVWSSQHEGTAGCTATSLANMQALTQWLDKNANPILIQLPVSVSLQICESRKVIML